MLQGFTRWLVALVVVALAGIIALQIAYPDAEWRPGAQMALVWLALAAVAAALLLRAPAQRGRVLLAFSPALALVALGVVAPQLGVFLAGAALGWIAVTQIVFRGPTRMAYQTATRHLHRNEIPEAVAVMDGLIAEQPDDAEHYRFRAELYRLLGALDRAERDYERAIKHAPYAPGGYLGLAELSIQQGQLDTAREYVEEALGRDPTGWMPAYNLGLIADRQRDAAGAIAALEQALSVHIPDDRYRLLAQLWLARAYMRRGQLAPARKHLEALRRETGALEAWRVVFGSEQAATLRDLLADDVDLAARLIDGSAPLDALAAPTDEEKAP